MEVTWLPVYYPSQQEKDDPKLYAENVRRFMANEASVLTVFIHLPRVLKLSTCLCSRKYEDHNHINSVAKIIEKLVWIYLSFGLFTMQGYLILSDMGLAEKRVYHAALNGNKSTPIVHHKKDD